MKLLLRASTFRRWGARETVDIVLEPVLSFHEAAVAHDSAACVGIEVLADAGLSFLEVRLDEFVTLVLGHIGELLSALAARREVVALVCFHKESGVYAVRLVAIFHVPLWTLVSQDVALSDLFVRLIRVACYGLDCWVSDVKEQSTNGLSV